MQTRYKYHTVSMSKQECLDLASGKTKKISRASNNIRTHIIMREDERGKILRQIEDLKAQLNGKAKSSFKSEGGRRRRKKRRLCTACDRKFKSLAMHNRLKHGGLPSNLPVLRAGSEA